MGDDSLILREDGYIRMNFPVNSLTYHSNLNIILVKNDTGSVHVLDVNSGVILQSTSLSAGKFQANIFRLVNVSTQRLICDQYFGAWGLVFFTYIRTDSRVLHESLTVEDKHNFSLFG